MRILCITHCLPYPATTGGNQRTALLWRALSRYGETDLIQVCRYGPADPELIDHCRERFNLLAAIEPVQRGRYRPWNVIRPLRPRFVDRLAQALGDQTITYRPDPRVRDAVHKAMSERHYDVIVGRYLYPTAMADVLGNPARIPVLVDVDDVDHIVARDNTSRSTPWLRRLVYSMHRPHIERVVPPLLNAASHLWVSAANDARDLHSVKCSVLPNIPYSESDQMIVPCPPSDQSRQILIVGMLSWMPNVEGIDHFLTHCWPHIRQAVPDATVRIVGGGLSPRTRERWSARGGVEVTGFVADLRAEYARCAFAVVPIQRGGGTKIKAIECFAYGRTCVVTPQGHRGLESLLRHGEALLLANNNVEFTDGCVQLLESPEFRNTLAKAGSELVNDNYSFSHFQRIVGDALADLGVLNSKPSQTVSLDK